MAGDMEEDVVEGEDLTTEAEVGEAEVAPITFIYFTSLIICIIFKINVMSISGSPCVF